MFDYFYITIVYVVIIFIMIREIYSFNQGKYYPYLNWKNKKESFNKKMFDTGLLAVLLFCVWNLNLSPVKLPDFLPLLPIITFLLCISILNYLSYAKIKDLKIIYQTVILDISLIVLFLIVIMMRRIIP